MDPGFYFAKNLVKIRYEEIPPKAIELAKKDILDTLGVSVAGSKKPGASQLMELVGDWGGKKESTVIMFNQKVPAPFAALVNGAMAHSLDYDDIIRPCGHLGVSIVPAAFATAERKKNINGKTLLTAVTLGIDLAERLAEASIGPAGVDWLFTSLYGIFGSTACAGKVLGLDEDQMVNALGIAYAQAAGNFQCVWDGALTKRIQPGFASKGGVLSALMASKGITGAREIFEGKSGLFPVYHKGKYNAPLLVADLGKRFAIDNLGFKAYPCCGNLHPPADATLELVKKNNISRDNVEEILVHVSEESRGNIEPLEIKQKPRTFIDAQFSIPWVVATAIVKKKVGIGDFTPESITDPEVLQVAQKVKAVVDLARPAGGTTAPAIVEIKIKGSGEIYRIRTDIAKGHPDNPMSWENLADKFRDCASQGIRPLSQHKIEEVIQAIGKLEEVDDVGKIIQMVG